MKILDNEKEQRKIDIKTTIYKKYLRYNTTYLDGMGIEHSDIFQLLEFHSTCHVLIETIYGI